MPFTGEQYDPKNVLKSKTTKKVVGDGLDTAGIVEVDTMSAEVAGGPTVRLGLLLRANQTIQKFRYPSTNYDVLSGKDLAIQADLNKTLLRSWEKGVLKWAGFSVPMEKIPWKIQGGKINVDVEFSLKPFVAGGAQDMVIVFQPGTDTTFGTGHFNYGVSVLQPSRGGRPDKKAAPKAPPKPAKSRRASKGRSRRRAR